MSYVHIEMLIFEKNIFIMKNHSLFVCLSRLRSFRVNPTWQEDVFTLFLPNVTFTCESSLFLWFKHNDVHKICSLSPHSCQGVIEMNPLIYLPTHLSLHQCHSNAPGCQGIFDASLSQVFSYKRKLHFYPKTILQIWLLFTALAATHNKHSLA